MLVKRSRWKARRIPTIVVFFPSAAFKAEGRKLKEREMFDWTRAWIRLRREQAAMRAGKLIDLFYDDESYVFARQLGAETIVVAFNREAKQKKVTIPVGSIGVKDGVMLDSIVGGMQAIPWLMGRR